MKRNWTSSDFTATKMNTHPKSLDNLEITKNVIKHPFCSGTPEFGNSLDQAQGGTRNPESHPLP